MTRTRYKREELTRDPWPHECPDCKGLPFIVVRDNEIPPFSCSYVVEIADKIGPDAWYVMQCDLCKGRGTVMKK